MRWSLVRRKGYDSPSQHDTMAIINAMIETMIDLSERNAARPPEEREGKSRQMPYQQMEPAFENHGHAARHRISLLDLRIA